MFNADNYSNEELVEMELRNSNLSVEEKEVVINTVLMLLSSDGEYTIAEAVREALFAELKFKTYKK